MITYKSWFEIAETTIRHRQASSWYLPNAARAGALAAVEAAPHGRTAQIDAMVETLSQYEIAYTTDDPCDAWSMYGIATRCGEIDTKSACRAHR